MKSKSSKVDKIKNCLKTGLPVASIAVGIMAICTSCEDNSDIVNNTPPSPPPVEKQVDPDGKSISVEVIADPKKNTTVEKIVFNDNDFSWNSTRLSTAGEKKLEDFMKRLEKRYNYSYNIKIDIVDANAQRKRKKAQVIFNKFSFVFTSTAGIALSTKRIIAERIAWSLNEEYKFIGEKRGW